MTIEYFENRPPVWAAVQFVGYENLKEVLYFTQGKVSIDAESAHSPKVIIPSQLNEPEQELRIGEWVMKQGSLFFVYLDSVFNAKFVKKEKHLTPLTIGKLNSSKDGFYISTTADAH